MAYQNTTHTLRTHDHFELFWQQWKPEGQIQRVLVFQHGIGEHSGRYQHMIEALAESGTAIYALESRGHGRTQGIRGHIDDFSTYTKDLGVVVQLASNEHDDQPVFLLGHSLGGAIALAYALDADHQNKLRGLILSSPAIEMPLDFSARIKKQVASLLVKVAPSLTTDTNLNPQDLSHDPQVGQDFKKDPLTHGKISVAMGHALFKLHKYFYAKAKTLKIPTYIFHGTGDRITSPEGSKRFYHLLRQSDKMLRLYDGLYHETMNEKAPDRNSVLQDLKQWILAH